MEDFVNRESQFPNRRRLEIVSQTPNEIIADIYREEGAISNNGTPITAQTLNAMKNEFANRGTTINVNGEAQSSINFTSDPQQQIDNLQENKANYNLSNVTYPEIMYDTSTKLFDGLEHLGAGDRVVENFISSDGNTWYRKWASGWKECGLKNIDIGIEKDLPLNFITSDYDVTFEIISYGNTAGMGADVLRTNKTTSKIKVGDIAYWQDLKINITMRGY